MSDFKDYILDQLSEIEGVRADPMFGGHGLYYHDFFFGIVYKSTLYLKTDEGARRAYINAGMKPFSPNEKVTLRDYYQVPPEIVDDKTELSRWVRQAFGIQRS